VIRSRESAIIATIPSHALGVQLEAQRAAEIVKGCEPTIWPQPVALEPSYTSMYTGPRAGESKQILATYENGYRAEDLVRLRIWISPQRAFAWTRCESFLKQLSGVAHRVLFEITGNQKGVSFSLGCHREDLPIVQIAFEAKIEHCMITPQSESQFDLALTHSTNEIRLRDYRPEPPYHHLLTRPEELEDSPYEGLIAALTKLVPPTMGQYQVLFQPVSPRHSWHQNVELLTDLEYSSKQISHLTVAQRYPQQIPSGALNPTANKLESKAHNDKPFFAVAVRIAIVGSTNPGNELLALTTPMSLFQHGGQRLGTLTEADYAQVLSPGEIHQMLSCGLTYRPGFLVNSDELAGLAHVPPARLLERWDSALDLVDPFTEADLDLSEGVPIGTAKVAGCERTICLTPEMRTEHVHIIGYPGRGKSCEQESMILHDIRQGHGVIVLDPHGDLVSRLLTLIPREAVPRTIYFNPGDPEWVPQWNPMSRVVGRDIGCSADNLIGVLKGSVTGWGDRMETILRQTIFGLQHIEHTSFLDLSDLLRTGTPESREMKAVLLQVVQDVVARQFWLYDHKDYRADEFGPVRHKLSKLLIGGTSALMLSQPYNRLCLQDIMDNGRILLVDLSRNIGTETCDLLGGIMLASIHTAALGRSDTPEDQRTPCYVYVDEAPRFVTDRLKRMLEETRKFGVYLTLAHQHMRQFSPEQVNALAGVGTTIVFNVGRRDAEFLAKDFLKPVKADDIRALERREALVRIGSDTAKIRTQDRSSIPEINYRDEIINQSHDKYCLPIGKVRELIRNRRRGHGETFKPLAPEATAEGRNARSPTRVYDEL